MPKINLFFNNFLKKNFQGPEADGTRKSFPESEEKRLLPAGEIRKKSGEKHPPDLFFPRSRVMLSINGSREEEYHEFL